MSALDFLAQRGDPDRARRVLTHAEALALAELTVTLVSVPTGCVKIWHRASAVTKLVNQRVQCQDVDDLVLWLDTRLGSDVGVRVGTNVRDAATLQRVIRNAEAQKSPQIRKEDQEPPDSDDPSVSFLRPQTYTPVTLWHDRTVEAMATARGDTLAHMVSVMEGAETATQPLTMTGTVVLSAQVQLIHFGIATGRIAWSEATDSEVTVTARTPDGTASGWSGQAHRDWAQIDPPRVVRAAAAIANRSRGAVKAEPGRQTAILSPAAAGLLVAAMHQWFNAEGNRGQTSPFGLVNSPDGKKLRLGQRVFDERITMFTDPNDPMGGGVPFFGDATPSGATTWIERGVLRALAYDVNDALDNGKTPIKDPASVHMVPAPGTKTATIDEMIASCARGIYVNRFSGINLMDRDSGGFTGNTRDGCFLVKDGKIQTPVTNFRFFESPFLMLNRVMAVGVPERVAFGYRPPLPGDGHDGLDNWPPQPVIVPPLMIRDFNFVALSDAI